MFAMFVFRITMNAFIYFLKFTKNCDSFYFMNMYVSNELTNFDMAVCVFAKVVSFVLFRLVLSYWKKMKYFFFRTIEWSDPICWLKPIRIRSLAIFDVRTSFQIEIEIKFNQISVVFGQQIENSMDRKGHSEECINHNHICVPNAIWSITISQLSYGVYQNWEVSYFGEINHKKCNWPEKQD